MAKKKELIQKHIEELLASDIIQYDDNGSEIISESTKEKTNNNVEYEYSSINSELIITQHHDLTTTSRIYDNTEEQEQVHPIIESSNNREIGEDQEEEVEIREFIETKNKKRKRICNEPNESFFCSCQHNKIQKTTIEAEIEDEERIFVTSWEIDVYSQMLQEKIGPHILIMKVDFFTGFLRTCRAAPKRAKVADEHSHAKNHQEILAMTGPFTDEHDAQARQFCVDYPTKEAFAKLKQVK